MKTRTSEESAVIVGKWMNPDPVTVTPGTSVGNALRLLACHSRAALPVVDGDRLVGLFSARDARDMDPCATAGDDRPVSTVMAGPVVVARPDESIPTAAYRMLDRHLEVLPVLDRGRFVGVVTLADCARAFLAADAAAADDVDGSPLERTLEPA